MTQSTLENPSPLGIFRQFIVEQNGEHKDYFDIKGRALTTLTDIGRLLILSHKVKGITNTAERFEKLAVLEPQNKELFLACASAAKTLLKFRIKSGIENDDNGRYLNIKNLKKEDKVKLKRCFKAISNAQELIKMRFKAY
ncbi:MAG: putative nucleotidyltransferase substrate binding domain-containing protein, partial [Flavobacteriaceae bacterium]|nr:putative nucleotidyltransferase substrate binding domain-containing protein [Flavobacteriaceae bacterium]